MFTVCDLAPVWTLIFRPQMSINSSASGANGVISFNLARVHAEYSEDGAPREVSRHAEPCGPTRHGTRTEPGRVKPARRMCTG